MRFPFYGYNYHYSSKRERRLFPSLRNNAKENYYVILLSTIFFQICYYSFFLFFSKIYLSLKYNEIHATTYWRILVKELFFFYRYVYFSSTFRIFSIFTQYTGYDVTMITTYNNVRLAISIFVHHRQ